MSRRRAAPGDVLLARLPQLVPPGSEQAGTRPVLVVALPERLGAPRYPLLVIAPLTTQISEWAGTSPLLYPVLRAGIGGLVKDSAIMLDHVRGMDVRRVIKPLGTLSAAEYGPIQAGFERMFEFEGRR